MVALFVVLTFILFILIDFLVLKAQGRKHPAFSTLKVFDSGFMYPGDVYLSKGHTWLKLLQDGLVRIGVDEFVQKTLSGISFNTMLNEGDKVKKGDIIFSGVSGENLINFYAPVNGVIARVNKNASKSADDPYRNWVISIEPENIQKEVSVMKFREAAVNWLAEEFGRLRDFLSFHSNDMVLAGATIHDGGNIVEGVVKNLNSGSIKEFENQFLKV